MASSDTMSAAPAEQDPHTRRLAGPGGNGRLSNGAAPMQRRPARGTEQPAAPDMKRATTAAAANRAAFNGRRSYQTLFETNGKRGQPGAKKQRLTSDEIIAAIKRVQAANKIRQRYEEAKQSYGQSLDLQRFAQLEGVSNASKLHNLLVNCDQWRHDIKESQRTLAQAIARRVRPDTSIVSAKQLEEAGIAKLDRAIDKFDSSMGFKFSTYAHFWIKAGAINALKELSSGRGIPKALFAPAKQALSMRAALEAQLGRAPSHEELARAMGVTQERIEVLLAVYLPQMNLDEAIGDDEGATKLDQVAAGPEEDTAASDAAAQAQMRQWLAAVHQHLPKLDWRSRMIIKLRNGMPVRLPGQQEEVVFERGASLRVCADAVGLSYERVRQLELKAMAHLSKLMPTMQVIDNREETDANTAGYAKKA